mgnify:CR=1 FL=1
MTTIRIDSNVIDISEVPPDFRDKLQSVPSDDTQFKSYQAELIKQNYVLVYDEVDRFKFTFSPEIIRERYPPNNTDNPFDPDNKTDLFDPSSDLGPTIDSKLVWNLDKVKNPNTIRIMGLKDIIKGLDIQNNNQTRVQTTLLGFLEKKSNIQAGDIEKILVNYDIEREKGLQAIESNSASEITEAEKQRLEEEARKREELEKARQNLDAAISTEIKEEHRQREESEREERQRVKVETDISTEIKEARTREEEEEARKKLDQFISKEIGGLEVARKRDELDKAISTEIKVEEEARKRDELEKARKNLDKAISTEIKVPLFTKERPATPQPDVVVESNRQHPPPKPSSPDVIIDSL